MTNSESNDSHLKRSKTSLLRRKKSEYIGSNTLEQRKSDDQDSKQEERYKILIENIPCAVYSAFPGETGPTTFMSKNWKDWTGYSAEEFYQDPEAWPKCIYPDDREKVVNAYVEACKNEVSYNLEYRIIHRDTGQVRYVRDRGVLSKDTKGILIRIDGSITDITEVKTSENELVKYRDHLEELVKERTAELEKANEVLELQKKESQKAAEALGESENRYKAVVENASEGITVVQDRIPEYVNPRLIATMGYSEEELTSQSFIEFVHPDDREQVMEIHLKRFKGEEVPPVYELRIIDKQGNTKWLENNGILIEWGGRLATLNFLRDITERKRAEELLRQSTNLLRESQEVARLGHYMFDTLTGSWQSSDILDSIFGIGGDYPRSVDGWLHIVHRDHRDEMSAYFYEVVLGQCQPFDREYRITRVSDQQIRWVHGLGRLEFDKEGKPARMLGTIQDITDRKKAEEKLLDYQAKLKSLALQLSVTEESERRRIATELHDQIGQSLVFSKIKLDELHQSATSGEFTKALNEICNNIDQIIQDTRTLTFDLSYPILYELGFEAAVSEWLDEQIEAKHGIETEFEDDGQQKPLDDDIRALLFRNVRELLANVVKHANAHKVKVSIRRVNEHIHINVEDDGKGFDSVKVTSRVTEETKLGLFSIRQRLDQLGGQFEIKSEQGHGSKITMTAPLKVTKSEK